MKSEGLLPREEELDKELSDLRQETLQLPIELWTTSSKMRGMIFPTMTETDWIDLEKNPKSECLLNTTTPVTANPFASILVDDNDDWATTDFSYLTQPKPWEAQKTQPNTSLPATCRSTRLEELKRHVMMPITGPLAAKYTTCLPIWRTTCSGADFMRIGMCTYWRDPIESPKRLRQLRGGYQRIFSVEEDIEFRKLLDEEIRDEIVMEVPPYFPAYVSPKAANGGKSGTGA
jgi:hypothetical protein